MHVMISELDQVWLLYMLLFQFEVHPYVHSYLRIIYIFQQWVIAYKN